MMRKAAIAGLTLATCVTVALWIDSCVEPSRWASYGVNCFDHACTLQHTFYDADSSRIGSKVRLLRTDRAHKWGFGYSVLTARDRRIFFVFFPLYAPVLILAAYPFVAVMRGPLRRYRRRRCGLCLTCGYDLTGNESGRCPECATEVERG